MPTCVEKRLSKTKAGEREGHRPAIGLSKGEALLLFPEPSLGKDIPYAFDCEDHTGKRWRFEYTNRATGPRIRPIEGYLKSYSIGPGDTITICAPARDGHPYTISFAAGDGDPWREGEEVPEPEEEGGSQQILVNRYERNPRNRQAAIQEHGFGALAAEWKWPKFTGRSPRVTFTSITSSPYPPCKAPAPTSKTWCPCAQTATP